MKKKIGLALGGGGARGLAHVGVLKVLEEERIPVDLIVGTSMGAIIGAMYAQNPGIKKLTERLESFFTSQDYESLGLKFIVPKNDQNPSFLTQLVQTVANRIVVNIAQSRAGIIKTERLSEAIAKLIDDGKIEDTRIKFACAATDLNSGQTVLFEKGDIRSAVTISSSIPGFIKPHKTDGQLLSDGGITAPVPIIEARQMGADVVIGVSVDPQQIGSLEEPHVLSIISRADMIRGRLLSRILMKSADIQLLPALGDVHWSELLRYKEFITAGEQEARDKISLIRSVVFKKQSFFQRFFH
jgi:NTE family protein